MELPRKSKKTSYRNAYDGIRPKPTKPRSLAEIRRYEREFGELLWYNRSQSLKKAGLGKNDSLATNRQMLAAMSETERKYSKKDFNRLRSMDLNELGGKLSALRWVLGERWDMLDT